MVLGELLHELLNVCANVCMRTAYFTHCSVIFLSDEFERQVYNHETLFEF